MLEKPPPTGVVTGPFSPTRVRSIDSITSLGMYSPYFSKASAPTEKDSHSNLTPVASRMRTVACVTSGPMPSPGMSVTLWFMCTFQKWPVASDQWPVKNRIRIALSDHWSLTTAFYFHQISQLVHELLHILEIQIHRGEAHVCHFVVTAQTVHDQFAEFAGLALAFLRLDDEGLGLIHNLFQF